MPPAADAHSARLARDDRLALEAQQRIHIANRWALIPLSLALALVAGTADSIGAPLVPLAALPALNAVVTGAAHLLLARGRFAVWHFRALAFWDAATFAAVALLLGPYGYFVQPLIVFAATQSTSLYPAAGRDFALAAVPAYAAARAYTGGAPWVAVVIESVLLAGICAVTYAREASLVRRLAAVRVALGRVERGDLTVRLRDGVRDNVGLLSASLNRTVGSLRRLVGEIQGQAGGLAGLAENLAATAQEVEAAAGEIGYVSGSIADEAERQLAVVAEGRTRADEAARSSRALGEQAVSSSAAARLLAGEAAAQGEQIRRTAELLLALGEGHRKSAASMAELEGAGGQVSGFASAIRAIAAQTDLLALNAAIEAARAGERGLGFGVVADEVRKLAVRSTDSAGSIAEVVARTQKAIVQMRERLGAESERIAQAGGVAEEGRVALASVLEGLERTVAFIERIAADARAQSGTIEHLHAGMGEIDGIARSVVERTRQGASAAEHQAAAMEQLSAGSQQLADVALRLRTLAGRFRVGGGAGKKNRPDDTGVEMAEPGKQGRRALAAVR